MPKGVAEKEGDGHRRSKCQVTQQPGCSCFHQSQGHLAVLDDGVEGKMCRRLKDSVTRGDRVSG